VGLTAREVGADVTRLLKEKDIHRDPQVSVELIRVANLSVTVSGAVRTQGVQKFAGELSVFDALLRAGGADPDAADEILVVRADAIAPGATAGAEGDSVLRVSRRGLEAGDRAANIELHDGDHVIVPKAQQVFISGYVRSPGPYTIEAGMTLRQAVVLAGGISERGSDRRIDILRRDDAGKEEKVKDVTLSTPVKAGDTIIVKSRFF
jgi:polysaccharide export outer membrane protein